MVLRSGSHSKRMVAMFRSALILAATALSLAAVSDASAGVVVLVGPGGFFVAGGRGGVGAVGVGGSRIRRAGIVAGGGGGSPANNNGGNNGNNDSSGKNGRVGRGGARGGV